MADKLNRIIQGDCVEQLRRLKAGTIDLAFADPPFNIGYDYDEYDDRKPADVYLDWSREWISGVIRVLKPDGAFWLAIGDEYAAELKVMATRELGLTCRSWVVWYYTFGVHCKHKFTRSHAHLFHFVKDAKRFTFNSDEIRVPSARQLVYGDSRANAKGRVPDDTWIVAPSPLEEARTRGGALKGKRAVNGSGDAHYVPSSTWILRPQDIPASFTADSDTWYFPRVCGTFKERKGFHGCQMPEQLLGRIIRACSNEGETVLDPFAGSGTTLAVAKKLGRSYLGFELSRQYATESQARLKRTKAGEPLDGPENPLASAPTTANGTVRAADGTRVKKNGAPARRSGEPAKRGRPRKQPADQPGLWG